MSESVLACSSAPCVLFDFADTLAELHPSRQDVVADLILRLAGLRVPVEHIVRSYRALDAVVQYSSVNTTTVAQRVAFYHDYNQRLLTLLGVLHKVPVHSLFDAFDKREKHWVLKPGSKQTMRALRDRGYKIGIISNFDDCLTQIIHDRLGLSELIDYLYISQNEGLEKPDTRFYHGFFKKHAVSIQNSYFLGDSYALDFLPAVKIGLRTWLLDEAGLYEHCPETIRSISDLLPLIP